MIVRIQFSNGKSGEYEIGEACDECNLIDRAYKDHRALYVYKAFYDATTEKYSVRAPCLPFVINPVHIVLIEVIEE